MSITLTASAASHIQGILSQDQAAFGLRLGVRKSGCTGYAYVIDLAKAMNEGDTAYEQHEVKVVVNKDHLAFLEGVEVDYRQTGLNASFHFSNPNVTDTCGCGESFAIKEKEES